MNYIKSTIKNGINLHLLNTNKFKTNLFSVFITTPLDRSTITKNALIAAVLRRGTQNMQSQDEISKNLENMYGASFDCGVEKTGDNHVIKFYLECINDSFLPNSESILKQCFNILTDIVFNPITRNNHFFQEYVESEKENLKQIIEGKIDNKNLYATDRCIEEIYINQPYGLFKYGYTEDLKNINAQNLYEYYINLINKSKIDIFISGDISEGSIDNLKNNINLNKLNERNANYFVCETNVEKKKTNDKINLVEEKMQINQGKLVIGLDTYTKNTDASIINNPIRKFATSVYNIILGGSANSKLFQNVREKESLAYTSSSNYIRVKDLILIKAGIEIENYNKAVSLIKEQLEQIKKEEFLDEEVENAKKLIISTVESIPDSQDSEITYYFSQELASENISIDEYINNIRKVSKKDVVLIANEIAINTIYFLRN